MREGKKWEGGSPDRIWLRVLNVKDGSEKSTIKNGIKKTQNFNNNNIAKCIINMYHNVNLDAVIFMIASVTNTLVNIVMCIMWLICCGFFYMY